MHRDTLRVKDKLKVPLPGRARGGLKIRLQDYKNTKVQTTRQQFI
jgi:hypothetical protein